MATRDMRGLEAVAGLDLDGCCALKDAMPRAHDARDQQVKIYRFWVPSEAAKRERFIDRLQGPLNRRYSDVGDHAVFALNEALMNVEEHAHHNDPKKAARVTLFLFPHRIVQTVQYVPTRFDPATVRTSSRDADGNLYNKPRGRGHIMMTNLSGAVCYPLSSAGGPPPSTWEIYLAYACAKKE